MPVRFHTDTTVRFGSDKNNCFARICHRRM